MTLEVPDFSDAMVAKVREVIVANAHAELRSRKNSILLELAREEDAGSDFVYKVRKYLYTIKTHPRLQEKYGKCCEYVERLRTQQQPENMSYEEWVTNSHHRGKSPGISEADCKSAAQTQI